jgi:hypothetical protein
MSSLNIIATVELFVSLSSLVVAVLSPLWLLSNYSSVSGHVNIISDVTGCLCAFAHLMVPLHNTAFTIEAVHASLSLFGIIAGIITRSWSYDSLISAGIQLLFLPVIALLRRRARVQPVNKNTLVSVFMHVVIAGGTLIALDTTFTLGTRPVLSLSLIASFVVAYVSLKTSKYWFVSIPQTSSVSGNKYSDQTFALFLPALAGSIGTIQLFAALLMPLTGICYNTDLVQNECIWPPARCIVGCIGTSLLCYKEVLYFVFDTISDIRARKLLNF